MEYKDYYQILGVENGASQAEVQKAYRRLARKHHPDVNRDPAAEARFKEIGEAYEVLKDPDKRTRYDQFGTAWKRTQQTGAPPPGWEGFSFDFAPRSGFEFGDFGPNGFSSFFEMLFGGAGGPSGAERPFTSGSTRVGQGRDRESRLALSLEELAAGGKRSIELLDPRTGHTKTLEVNLPKGILPGQRVRLAGQGERGRGVPGDLFLHIEALPHPRFELRGRDLHTDVEVTPWDAALGGQLRVPTLDGTLQVKLPPASSSGQKIRLRGRGMPGPDGGGDLYATIKIVVPQRLSARERELFERLRAESGFSPAH